MKVGQKSIDNPETERRVDEDVRFTRTAHDLASMTSSNRFENANGGGANSDNAPALAASRVNSVRGFFRHEEFFGVHNVILDLLGFDRCERARSHMQRDIMNLNSFYAQSLEKIFSEMEAGRGRCDGAFSLGVNSLVTQSVRR
jgi:hypothetical protein